METNRFTIRDAIMQILGQEAARNILKEHGDDWAIAATICMIRGNGGPQNETERRFIKWSDDHLDTP